MIKLQLLMAMAAGLWVISSQAEQNHCKQWPLWQQFQQHLVHDGRVIDPSDPRKITTSEGQSYALFFALVANQPKVFAQLLQWTQLKLAKGDLSAQLPAWLWGQLANGEFGVIDNNPASDSDLWIAYSLIEAGRLWRNPDYTRLGKLMAIRIWREEVIYIPDLGHTILPAPKGFDLGQKTWRLNPSYVPMQVLQVLASIDVAPQWQDALIPAMKLITQSAAKGFAPDWIRYKSGQGFFPDSDHATGSYGAIRVYLWAGMLSRQSKYRSALLQQLRPMTRLLAQGATPPEKINTVNLQTSGQAPLGFYAALIPFLHSQGQQHLVAQLKKSIQEKPFSQRPLKYYEQMLALFSEGWQQQRYHFDRNGHVVPAWDRSCAKSVLAVR